MSMPPMQGPPGTRPVGTGPPQQPGAPQGASGFDNTGAASPTPGIQASRRRAYPTSYLATNSVTYNGSFDAGAQAAAGSGFAPVGDAGGFGPVQEGHFFTPGAPELSQQQAGYPQQQPQGGPNMGSGFANGQLAVAAGYSGAAGAGMAGLADQFSNMGVAGTKGVSTTGKSDSL